MATLLRLAGLDAQVTSYSFWTDHVGNTGVTCWTCHRGEPVPEEKWSLPVAHKGGILGNRAGQNEPVSNSAYSSLPNAAVARYLLGVMATQRRLLGVDPPRGAQADDRHDGQALAGDAGAEGRDGLGRPETGEVALGER